MWSLSGSSSGTPAWVIAVAVIGAVVGLIVIGVLIYFCVTELRKEGHEEAAKHKGAVVEMTPGRHLEPKIGASTPAAPEAEAP